MNYDLRISYDEYILKFRDLVKSLGLKNSQQREYVLLVLFENGHHLTAEEIQKYVTIEHKIKINVATVYKTLSLFEELGVVKSLLLEGNESKVYELDLETHHDHLVCTKCHKIIEFYKGSIESMQDNVAMEYDFQLQSHTMILYGLCKSCQSL